MSKKLPTAVPGRLCWDCQLVTYSPAMGGYGEYTPGASMTLECSKRYWSFREYDDLLPDLKTKLKLAERCADFVQAKA